MAKPIKGDNGDNIIKGNGGGVLAGGRGDDVYIVFDETTRISETRNGGHDTVQAETDYALDSWLENLELIGDGDFYASGNELDNVLTGNDGNNTIDGGDGNDTLAGGGGSNVLNGGEGDDTAVYSGSASDFVITRQGDIIFVTSADGTTDQLADIELIAFDDGIVATNDIGMPLPDEPPAPPPTVVADDAVDGVEDETISFNVLANDSGEGLVLIGVSEGTNGTVTFEADGNITYAPTQNFFGSESLTYTAIDSAGLESTANVVIDVVPVNDAPVAADDHFEISGPAEYDVGEGVLSNDMDPDGDALSVVAFEGATNAGGYVLVNENGTFTYQAAEGFEGDDEFDYTVVDNAGATATATVHLHVHNDDGSGIAGEPGPDGTVPHYVEGLVAPGWESTDTPTQISFMFLGDVPDYYPEDHHVRNGFAAMNYEQQEAIRLALSDVSEFSQIEFIEVTDPDLADLTFGFTDLGGWAGMTAPSTDGVGISQNDVWLSTDFLNATFAPGTSAFKTMLHEVGHTLGLDHVDRTFISEEEDDRGHTIMSAAGPDTFGHEPSEFMLFDIAAIQHLYGANETHANGEDIYTYDDVGDQLTAIWDTGGHDTLDMSGAGQGVTINLGQGEFSTAATHGTDNLAIAFGTEIEDAVGSDFDDNIAGNELDNSLTGGTGNDLLSGGEGLDRFTFDSSSGNDNVTDFVSGLDKLVFGNDVSQSLLEFSLNESGLVVLYGDNSILLEGIEEINEDEDLLFLV